MENQAGSGIVPIEKGYFRLIIDALFIAQMVDLWLHQPFRGQKQDMKRLFITTFILLTLPMPYSALAWQGPPPPPPPSHEYFPQAWEAYSSEKGRFRTRFPYKPKETDESNSGNASGIFTVLYRGILLYAVSYVEIAKPGNDLVERRQLLKEMKDAAVNRAQANNPQIIKEGEADVKGNPGYFIHIEMNKEVVRLKWVLVGNRLYSIVVSGRKGSAYEMEGKDNFEKMAMGFINSFDLI